MRRRTSGARVEPPARLRTFNPAEWAEAEWVDPPSSCSASTDLWIVQLRHRAWSRARLAYLQEFGWLDGDAVDVIKEHARTRRLLVDPAARW